MSTYILAFVVADFKCRNAKTVKGSTVGSGCSPHIQPAGCWLLSVISKVDGHSFSHRVVGCGMSSVRLLATASVGRLLVVGDAINKVEGLIKGGGA